MKEIFKQIHRYKEQDFKEGKPFEFTLGGKIKEDNNDLICQPVQKMEIGKSYKITVKKYMTELATANFDFQDKWNNGKPMPLCTMHGKVTKETRGMYYMELKEDDISWTGWVIRSSIKHWEPIIESEK